MQQCVCVCVCGGGGGGGVGGGGGERGELDLTGGKATGGNPLQNHESGRPFSVEKKKTKIKNTETVGIL